MNEMVMQYLEVEHPMGIIVYTKHNTEHKMVGNVVDVSDEAFMVDDIFDDVMLYAFDSISVIKFVDFDADYEKEEDKFMQECMTWMQMD